MAGGGRRTRDPHQRTLANIPQLVAALVSALNLKGDVPLQLEDLLGSVQLVNLELDDYVWARKGRLLMGAVQVAAVAGQQGFAHLAANQTIKALARIDEIDLVNDTVGGIYFGVGIAGIQGVYGTAGNVNARDDRNAPTGVAISGFTPTGGTAAAPVGGVGGLYYVPPTTRATIKGPWFQTGLQAVEILCAAVNTKFSVNWRWRERPLLPSEILS